MKQEQYEILKNTLDEDKENMISVNGEKYFIHQEKEGWLVDIVKDNVFTTLKVYSDYKDIFTDKLFNGYSLNELVDKIELEYY